MKVIGNGHYAVILEATPNEINRLAGKILYQWNSYRDCWEIEARVGAEFRVIEGIEQLHRNSERTAEVARLKQNLQSIILQLELIEPFMKEPEVAALKEAGIE